MQADAWRMIRRRAVAAGIIAPIGNHTFRATGITAYLGNGGALEHAQSMAAHESPRTTKLYDRTQGTAHAGRGGEDPAVRFCLIASGVELVITGEAELHWEVRKCCGKGASFRKPGMVL